MSTTGDVSHQAAVRPQGDLARHLRAGLEVTRAVASAPSAASAEQSVLPALCPQLNCQLARLWVRRSEAADPEDLICVDAWSENEADAELAMAALGTPCSGSGSLPGECFAAGGALAITWPDGSAGASLRFQGDSEMIARGIRSAAAFALQGTERALGVITLMFAAETPLDGGSLDLLLVLGETIGAVLESKLSDTGSREELRRQQLLLDASSAVASAGGYRDTLRALAANAVPGLADLCLIDLMTPAGALERVAAVHADPTKAALVRELCERYPPQLGRPHPAGEVVEAARSAWSARMPEEFLRATTQDERHFEIVRQLGFESYLCVPLWAGAEVLGTITLVSAGSGRVFGREDLLTAEQLAQQVAGTVARARDLELEHERNEQTQRRTTALVELGSALSAATSLQQALEALLATPGCALGAAAAWLGLVDEEQNLIRLQLAGSLPDEYAERYHVLSLDAPTVTTEAVRTNRRTIVPRVDAVEDRLRAALDDADAFIGAMAVEPVRADDGSVLGALGLGWPSPRTLSPIEIQMLDDVAAVLSRTVARIVVAEREHRIATAMQERMLTLDAHATTAVVAALYEPAAREIRIGGDWYTATVLDEDGRLGVSVGDVVGHGLDAVATMGQLRSALSIAALTAGWPADVLELLDRYAASVPGAACATVAYALIDPRGGTIDYACAGHPYPLLVAADGQTSWLEAGRRPPLTVEPPTGPAASGQSAFPVGSLLILYSDGLIERHGESLEDGMGRLEQAARDCCRLPAAAACAALRDRMAVEERYGDDVVVVALRPVGTTSNSHVDCVQASISQVPVARNRLRAWLESLGIAGQAAAEALVATGEAVNNAIEHGSELDSRRTITIEAFADDDTISISVGDAGHWSKDSAGSRRLGQRGRGLTLIHGLSHGVEISRGPIGTQVTMKFTR